MPRAWAPSSSGRRPIAVSVAAESCKTGSRPIVSSRRRQKARCSCAITAAAIVTLIGMKQGFHPAAHLKCGRGPPPRGGNDLRGDREAPSASA